MAARSAKANGGPLERGRAGAARLQLIAPSASPEEAAAIVAALERFMRATAAAPQAPAADATDAWWRAGILEGVEGEAQTGLREPWISG
jgi:hypothetical protein